ncbi:MAG TPA: AMP-binding protein, partial [Acidimicrobiales bacterium]|nr:AMP-binding protein [Acidimicrobiales bacterium]
MAEENPWAARLGVWWIAHDHPDLPAIAHAPSGEELTFGELAGRAHQVARALRAHGIEPGQIVALDLPNGLDAVVWQLAASEVGLRYIPLNPSFSSEEVRDILEHSGAAVLVLQATVAAHLQPLVARCPVPLRVAVGGEIPGFTPAATLLAGQPTTPPADRRLGGMIPYSSGTTGKPKAVWRDLPDMDPWDYTDRMKSFGQAFRFQPLQGAHLVSAGMHHGGCQGFYHGALNVGQALVILERFDAETTLALVDRHRVTTAYMVPTQFVRLLRLPDDVKARYDHSSLETVVHSAAPCPLEIKRQMLEWW